MLQNVQADFNETNVNSDAYVKNKPNLSNYATKSELPPDDTDYLCLTATVADSTVRLDKHITSGNPLDVASFEYSTDGKQTWTEYTWTGGDTDYTGATITLAKGAKVYFRGEAEKFNRGAISYHYFVMTGGFEATGNVVSLISKDCSKTSFNAFSRLFQNCAVLTKADVFPAKLGAVGGMEQMFANCTGLTSIELPDMTINNGSIAYPLNGITYGCTNLARIKVGFHAWNNDTNHTWFYGVANGTFICPTDLDLTSSNSRAPSGWAIERTSSATPDWNETTATSPAYILNKPTIPAAQIQSDWDESDSSALSFIANKGVATAVSVSDSTYTLSVGTAVPVVAVASALTLSANALTAGKVGYAEIVLDLAQGASVTAGSGLTMVDTLTAGKRNVCVARWQDGACKLYVVITEDLPVDESSSN